MKGGLDEYASLHSPLHHWEPRYKLVGLMALILAFSFVQDLRLLPAMLLVTAVLYTLARLPLSFLWGRLRTPGIFLLVVAILLPFFSGETVLLRLGPLALRQEGLLALLVIVAKFVSILTTGLILFGSAPFLTMIRAMRALGLPDILADMTLLAYRYLYEIGDDLERMERAMRLRGFQARKLSGRGFNAMAAVAGSLLVRSYERSERVYRAMLLRGHGCAPCLQEADVDPHYHSHWHDLFPARPRDKVALAAVLLVAAGLILAEFL